MAKAIFSILIVMMLSMSVLTWDNFSATGRKFGTDVTKSAGICFASQIVPADAQERFKLVTSFANDLSDFIIRAHSSIFNDNSAYKKCLDLIDTKPYLATCRAQNNGAECELVDKIIAVPRCPAGFSRVAGTSSVDSASCYQTCPEGFVTNGPICTKPDTYVLNNFRQEMECAQVNGGKPCSIYHVRYFVPDCKENFYRLGSTVCVPKCPKNFEDHETFCVRPFITRTDQKSVSVWNLANASN